MTTTSTSDGRSIQTFKDAAQVERYLCRALAERDWEWVSWIFEDARLMYAADLARFERKYGLSDYVIAVSLRLQQEADQPKQERLFS